MSTTASYPELAMVASFLAQTQEYPLSSSLLGGVGWLMSGVETGMSAACEQGLVMEVLLASSGQLS
jgi:hypothetical protein